MTSGKDEVYIFDMMDPFPVFHYRKGARTLCGVHLKWKQTSARLLREHAERIGEPCSRCG